MWRSPDARARFEADTGLKDSSTEEYQTKFVTWAADHLRAQPQGAPEPGLKVELAARNLRILGLEKSLDDAVVALHGILEHPGDEESWKDARKVLPSLMRMLDRHEFAEAGFDTCRHCGERSDHNNHIPAPGAPLNKGNAHQRPGISGSPDAPGRVGVCRPAGPTLYDTLKDAEAHLIAEGYKLMPDSCDWIRYGENQTVGAGCYYVDPQDAFNSKVRIEYEVLEKFDGTTSLSRPQRGGE